MPSKAGATSSTNSRLQLVDVGGVDRALEQPQELGHHGLQAGLGEHAGQLGARCASAIALAVEHAGQPLAGARVLERDPDLVGRDLEHVVRRPGVAPQPVGRHGARVHDQHVVEQPHVGHVLVARQHQVDLELGEQGEHVARVPHRVALPAGAGHGHQVVVEDEDLEVGLAGELVADPRGSAPGRPRPRPGRAWTSRWPRPAPGAGRRRRGRAA